MFLSSMLTRRNSIGRTDVPVEKLLPKQMTTTERKEVELALDRDAFKRLVSSIKNA